MTLTGNFPIPNENNDYKFKTTGQILIFDGYLKVYSDYETSEDVKLPDLTGIEVLTSEEIYEIAGMKDPMKEEKEEVKAEKIEKVVEEKENTTEENNE